MEQLIKSRENKKPAKWEKSVTTPDGTTKRVEVEQIENGFLATISMYNYSKEPVLDKTIKYYFKENPLKDVDEVEEEITPNILDNFLNPKIKLM